LKPIHTYMEPVMTASTSINSLGINSPSEWEEDPSTTVQEVTEGIKIYPKF